MDGVSAEEYASIMKMVRASTGGAPVEVNIGKKDGVRVVAIRAPGGGSLKMNELSAFDRQYLSNQHGGNPVTWGLPAPQDYVLELKEGNNRCNLVACSGVDQIHSIAASAPHATLVLSKFYLNKAEPQLKHHLTSAKDLMDCRTLFVPYRDCFTQFSIYATEPCTITINASKV